MTDITAIVTAHAETLLAGPTMRSADAAIARAEAAGLKVERLIGLDAPTPECRAFFEGGLLDHWRRIEMDHRDQGLARNTLAEAASGRWLAFLDADDLWSENWLKIAAETIHKEEENGVNAITHPEVNWVFDGADNIMAKVGQDDILFNPHLTPFRNYYDALAFAPRAAHLAHPYAKRDIARGFAFEDMQWNIETMAAGWRHVVAPGTIIFKRRRPDSQTRQANRRRVVIRDLSAMRIDYIRTLGNDS